MHASCNDRFSGDGILNVPVAAHVRNAESVMRALLQKPSGGNDETFDLCSKGERDQEGNYRSYQGIKCRIYFQAVIGFRLAGSRIK